MNAFLTVTLFFQIIRSFAICIRLCDANIIVISPEMKEGYCLILKNELLIISRYITNDDVVAQLTPMSSITNKLSPIAI